MDLTPNNRKPHDDAALLQSQAMGQRGEAVATKESVASTFPRAVGCRSAKFQDAASTVQQLTNREFRLPIG